MQFTSQLGSDCADKVDAGEVDHGDGHTGTAHDVPAQQDAGITGGHPGQTACEGGEIDEGHHPAEIVGVGSAYGGLGIVHHTASTLVACGHDGEGGGTDHGDGTADDPGQNADAEITPRCI